MQFFQDLGALVEQRWRDQNYSEERFPEIAAAALAETEPSKHVDPWDVIRWVYRTTSLPQQRDVEGRFGNPPVTLYDGARFYIDVYYWLDGTTSIHQHSFCGAFHVLMGSSILSCYDFVEQQKINAHFSTGRMVLNQVELLEQGAVQQILTGKSYIHSLFHLDRPSASVVIRTHQSPSGLPQYNYVKPYFAIDPFYKDPVMIKRVQSASLLLTMKHPQADELIGELLSSSDFHTAFSVLDLAYHSLNFNQLEKTFGLSTGKQRFEALFEIARCRHGGLVDLIPPVFEEVQRQQNLIQRRGQITSSDHRFFLALLLNVPERDKIFELVQQRFPERDPIDTVTDWVEELANTKLAGSSEANVLGINDFDDDYLFVLHGMLGGQTLTQMKQAFFEEAPAEDNANLDGKVEELYHSIRNSLVFKSLFLDASPAGSEERSATART